MSKDKIDDQAFLQPDLEAPAGMDRRWFLMRSATIGAAAVLTGCSVEEKAKAVVASLVQEHDLPLLHQVLEILERQLRRLAMLKQLSNS